MEVSLLVLVILTSVALIGGAINAISGGAGMLAVPSMLALGIPPINALALNKFQNIFGGSTSTITYFRRGFVDLKSNWPILIYALIGSCLGVGLLQWFAASDWLEGIVLYFLIFLALYVAFSPQASPKAQKTRLSLGIFNPIVGTCIGIYGGFFGPGSGPFIVLAYTTLRGYDLRESVTNSKPVLLIMNFTALVIFIGAGDVWWVLGCCMGAGQIIGARIGANLVLNKGTALVKPLLVIVPLLSAGKLLFF